MTWEQNRHFSKISDPRPSSISRSRPERGEFRMFEARYGESLSEANGGHKRFQSVNLRWFSSLQTYLWGGKDICFSEIDPRKKYASTFEKFSKIFENLKIEVFDDQKSKPGFLKILKILKIFKSVFWISDGFLDGLPSKILELHPKELPRTDFITLRPIYR